MKRSEIYEKALLMLKENDDLYIECINELDSWNGYADGFRAFSMCELDDFYIDRKATDLLKDLTEDFNINDEYFYFTIWGLESTDDIASLYRSNTYESDVLDNLIEYYNEITIWGYPEFDEVLSILAEEDEEADEN